MLISYCLSRTLKADRAGVRHIPTATDSYLSFRPQVFVSLLEEHRGECAERTNVLSCPVSRSVIPTMTIEWSLLVSVMNHHSHGYSVARSSVLFSYIARVFVC